MRLVFAAVDSRVTWYVVRASGLVLWLMCAAAILWGLVLSTRTVRRRGMPAWLADLHSFLGTLALVFCAVHLGALGLDRFVDFGWRELFVPFASRWRPGAVAWGIVAMYLLVAVQVTSWLRRRLPRRVWHGVHLTSFVIFVTGSIHGITAGADRTNRLVIWGFVAISALVTGMTIARFARPTGRQGRRELSLNLDASIGRYRSP